MGLRAELRQISTSILRATDGRDALLNTPDGWEVEQPWLWWLGPTGGGTGPFGHPLPGAGAGPWENAVALPAVSRATSLVVDTLAALPWHVYRGTDRLPTPDWIEDPQALRLDGRVVDDASPVVGDRWSSMDFWTQWLTSALWFGDGYVYAPSRTTDGSPKPPMWVVHPLDVDLRAGRYFVGDVELPPSTVIHLRGLEPIVDGHGSGVLSRFAAQLAYSQTLRDYAAGVFYTGVPAGYLKVTKEGLAQDKADELKAKWLAAHGGSQRSIAVLNATTEFHPLTFSPVDAALVDVMAADLNELANAFGIPGYLLGAPTDNNTYANVESRRIDLATFTYLPWTSRIEAVLDAQFPRGVSLKVALDGLLRADSKSRAETLTLYVEKGVMTVDEARALLDLPPMPVEEAIA